MQTTSPLGGLSARSPFGADQEHVEVVERCVEGLAPLFDALFQGDENAMTAAKDRIFEPLACREA